MLIVERQCNYDKIGVKMAVISFGLDVCIP